MNYSVKVIGRRRWFDFVLVLAFTGVLVYSLPLDGRNKEIPISRVDGKYVCSSGYFGDSLELERGRYQVVSFGCVGSEVSSEGEFVIEDENSLSLRDSQTGETRSLRIIDKGLLEKTGPGSYRDYWRQEEREGTSSHSAQGRGDFIDIPLNAPDYERGREVFLGECLECHGVEGLGTEFGSSLGVKDLRTIGHADRPRDLFTLQQIFEGSRECWIRHEADVSIVDYWNVTFYIFTLRGREPVLP